VSTRLFVCALLIAALAAAPRAQQPVTPEPAQLPVKRVVLYKSGVGYFEHQGSVTGSVDVSIQFTSSQLNDVLKSLTALDLDNGQISSIGYNSVAPLEQRLAALRVPLGTRPDLLQFYNALRGARVEIRSGATTTAGRLLGIERKPARDNTAEPTDILTVISNEGTVRSIELRPTVSVRIAEQDLRDDISRYLAVVASGRDQDVRRMTLAATGNGTRRLLVSYISEVPIWKSTYRLVLPDSHTEQAVLQGWAVVDNTVGADWTNVELSLVAGAPQSFIQQVSQPYYARRPVVPLPQAALLAPQTHAATLTSAEAPVPVQIARNQGSLQAITPRSALAESVVADGVRVQGGIPGGVSGGVVGAIAESAPGFGGGAGGGVARQAITVQNAQVAAPASAQDLGDLFEYRLAQPVTIRTNQSAMVPILNARVSAERVSIWNRTPGSGRPLRAVWLTNSSGLTLDGGTLSVIDANAFAGEGLVDPLKPSEKRLVSYGADLGVIVDAREDESSGRYTRLIAREGVVIAEQEDRARWLYRVRNEDAAPRTLVIEHPVRQGWTILPDSAPAETTASTARFRLPVAPRSEATLRVSERRVYESRLAIRQLDDRVIASFSQRGVSEEELRRVLQPVIDARSQLATVERQLSGLTTQVTSIASDQQRIRENIQALGTSKQERSLRDRYTRELTTQEDRLAELQGQIEKVSAERDRRQADLSRVTQQLAFDVTVK
jgi:hypothetical protein